MRYRVSSTGTSHATYKNSIKNLSPSSAFLGLGIIAYDVLLCSYEITHAHSTFLYDTETI